MTICEKLHGFSIHIILYSSMSEQEPAELFNCEGVEHECIEKNDNSMSRDSARRVFVSVAMYQPGARGQHLRPDAGPTSQRRFPSDAGGVGSAARDSARTARDESPHGANGITTEGPRGICDAYEFCGSVNAVRPDRSHSRGDCELRPLPRHPADPQGVHAIYLGSELGQPGGRHRVA